VFREAPRIVNSSVTKAIGNPADLEKNLENPSVFDKAVDLSIPQEAIKKLAPAPTKSEDIHMEEANTEVSRVPPAAVAKKSQLYPTSENPERIQDRIKQVIGDKDEVHYMPIKALNTFSTEWKIKARITKKHQKKAWKNAKTAGVLLNIELMDSAGTQITATFFNDIAERWDATLEEGKVYTFAGGSVKIANTKYTSIKNDYCIVFDRDSQIEQLADDQKIQAQGFSFVKIEEINEFEQQRTVDFSGVITEVGPVSVFQPKPSYDGTTRPAKDRRSLQLADETGLQI
jgi:ssDNA-binding replication factor A large subunit